MTTMPVDNASAMKKDRQPDDGCPTVLSSDAVLIRSGDFRCGGLLSKRHRRSFFESR